MRLGFPKAVSFEPCDYIKGSDGCIVICLGFGAGQFNSRVDDGSDYGFWVDQEAETIMLPAAVTKNKREHSR
jgi:hypothetical protein